MTIIVSIIAYLLFGLLLGIVAAAGCDNAPEGFAMVALMAAFWPIALLMIVCKGVLSLAAFLFDWRVKVLITGKRFP